MAKDVLSQRSRFSRDKVPAFRQIPSDSPIKLHVTHEQREQLEFLVNRAIADLEWRYKDQTAPPAARYELGLLELIKRELYEAGT